MEERIETIIKQTRLKAREAAKASAFLSNKPGGKISTSLCYKSTSLQIARYYPGSGAKEKAVDSLALEIATEVGLIEQIQVPAG